MIDRSSFPKLTSRNHRATSPKTPKYNCIAWAAHDTTHWWEPGLFWPIAVEGNEYGIAVLETAFQSLGFTDCLEDSSLEVGFEKIALYGTMQFYTHAVRQLPNGKWTSKLGKMEDIEHDSPNDVADGIYGEVLQIMKRPIGSTVPTRQERTRRKSNKE